MGCAMPALPRVHIECALVTEGTAIGRVAAMRPVLLATTYARAAGAAGPAALVVGVVPLAATCVGCTGAMAPDDADGGVEMAPWAAELDPSDHGPTPGLDGAGVASGTGCAAEEVTVPAHTKRALGTEAVRS